MHKVYFSVCKWVFFVPLEKIATPVLEWFSLLNSSPPCSGRGWADRACLVCQVVLQFLCCAQLAWDCEAKRATFLSCN